MRSSEKVLAGEARSAGIEEESRRRKKIGGRISPILDRFLESVISRISRRESRQLSRISRRESRQLSKISRRESRQLSKISRRESRQLSKIQILAPSFSKSDFWNLTNMSKNVAGRSPNNYRYSRGNLLEICEFSKNHSRVFWILDILAARTKKTINNNQQSRLNVTRPISQLEKWIRKLLIIVFVWPAGLQTYTWVCPQNEAAITGSLSRNMFRGSALPKWNFPALLKVALSQKMQSHVEFGTSSENQCKTNILFTTRSQTQKGFWNQCKSWEKWPILYHVQGKWCICHAI